MNRDELARRLRADVRHEVAPAVRAQHLAAISAAASTIGTAAAPRISARRGWVHQLAASASALTLVLVPGVALAQNALPGDALYSVKRATETVRTPFDREVAARNRVDEVTRLAARGADRDALLAALAAAEGAVSTAATDSPVRAALEQARATIEQLLEDATTTPPPGEDDRPVVPTTPDDDDDDDDDTTPGGEPAGPVTGVPPEPDVGTTGDESDDDESDDDASDDDQNDDDQSDDDQSDDDASDRSPRDSAVETYPGCDDAEKADEAAAEGDDEKADEYRAKCDEEAEEARERCREYHEKADAEDAEGDHEKADEYRAKCDDH